MTVSPDEYARLFNSLKVGVFQYARNRGLSPEQADDVVGETFEVVWRKRDHLPESPRDRAAWVFGVARNKVRQEIGNAVRRRHDRRFLTDDEAQHLRAVDDVAREVIQTDLGRQVLERLRDNERELLRLALVEGAAPRDAAALLMITTTAYTTRVSRLRTRLLALYDELIA